MLNNKLNLNISFKKKIMNKSILVLGLCLFFSSCLWAQAHLGISEHEIKNMYPEKVFESGYTKTTKQRFIYANFDLGTFYYYFDSTLTCNYCVQVPSSLTNMNTQAQIYNGKYTINSPRSWTAYLDKGGILSIKLEYLEDLKLSVFEYSDAK